jgi:pilus assembly protein CpaE
MNQKISVRIKVKSEDLGKELERMVLAAGGFRVHSPDDRERPDLLIYELGENVDEEFKLIQSLLASNGVAEVFVTSDKKEADVLLKAMRAGTKEFLHQPLDELEVQTALLSFKKRMEQTPGSKRAGPCRADHQRDGRQGRGWDHDGGRQPGHDPG